MSVSLFYLVCHPPAPQVQIIASYIYFRSLESWVFNAIYLSFVNKY